MGVPRSSLASLSNPLRPLADLIQVRALDPYFNQMRLRVETKKWRRNPEDYVIKGTDTYRTDDVYRAVSDFLRSHGWQTKKTNHALRAYSGCQIAMKYGIYEAQMFLRHATVKVTEENYSHFVRKFKPADMDTIPARWATAAVPVFQPKILPAAANG